MKNLRNQDGIALVISLMFTLVCLGMIMVLIYCNLGITPLWGVILVNVLLFVGISARMVSAGALISAVPDARDRGAYMSVNSSVQQFAGGMASGLAGSMGKLSTVGLAAAVFSPWMNISGSILANYWRRHPVDGDHANAEVDASA